MDIMDAAMEASMIDIVIVLAIVGVIFYGLVRALEKDSRH